MRVLSGLLVAFAVGCVGTGGTGGPDPGPGPGGGGEGETVFKRDVFPILGKCSSGSCHATTASSGALSKFYGADADSTYDASVAAAALVGTFEPTAPIITKIAPGHNAITYSTEEVSKITNWLSVETEERKGGNMPPPADPKALLREWSGCMTLENFNAANMAQLWKEFRADNAQACTGCHHSGLGSIVINADAATMFNPMSQYTGFMLKFFSPNTAENKMAVNTGSFSSANTLLNHPTFPLTNPAMTALQTFYDSTLAKKTAGTCDPPRLKD